VRLTRFQIVNLRTRVQEQALSHAFDEVKSRLTKARARLDAATNDCDAIIEAKVQDGRERLALAAASLDALSPLGVLQRGYAIAQDAAGKLVRDAGSVSVGDEVTVRLAKGKLGTRIERIEATD
jgi:exodeoxyribonuclease VII large subunit